MIDISFSFNLLTDLQTMWQYDFMQHAFEAGTIIAIIAGIVGYFVVLRRSSFAAHALSHIGFAGAAGAVLFGVDPIIGLLLFTSGGGITIALLGRRAAARDVQIGTVLAFLLGLRRSFHKPLQWVCYGSVLYLIRRNSGYKFKRLPCDAYCQPDNSSLDRGRIPAAFIRIAR